MVGTLLLLLAVISFGIAAGLAYVRKAMELSLLALGLFLMALAAAIPEFATLR